jgi:hypothetical protein
MQPYEFNNKKQVGTWIALFKPKEAKTSAIVEVTG